MNRREKQSLDRFITGNYGEDQFTDEEIIDELLDEDEYCDEDCSKCPIKLNYTFDQEG